MFTKRKRTSGRPPEILMFYSNNDLFYNSYLTEALDRHSIRCLHFILKKTNNTKAKFVTSWEELLRGAELTNPRYVKHALKILAELGLIETNLEKRKQTVKVLKTAKRLDVRKLR